MLVLDQGYSHVEASRSIGVGESQMRRWVQQLQLERSELYWHRRWPPKKPELDIPRHRDSNFEPQLVAKHRRRLPGFDDKVFSLYARGLPVREIQVHLTELYGLEVLPDLISTIIGEVIEWQNRPLEAMYPLVFFDTLRVKIRNEGTVKNKAVYLALGMRGEGTKEILGIWIEQTEGAEFWLRVINPVSNVGNPARYLPSVGLRSRDWPLTAGVHYKLLIFRIRYAVFRA